MNVYKSRRANLATWMARNSIALVIFYDSETARDKSIRYFTGHPGDAILGIRIDGEAVLSPWDEILAKHYAYAEKIIPFTDFERNPLSAAEGFLKELGIPEGSRVEIPGATPYPQFLRYVDTLNKFDILCRSNGVQDYCSKLRSIKDSEEINLYRNLSRITDQLTDKIEEGVREGVLVTESDVALFIEKECRLRGCDGTGFETLAAGPERSYGIHCFPSYTSGGFGQNGFSILDFGLVIKGYTSDVTLTFAKNLNPRQEKQLALVEEAYNTALNCYKPAIPCREAALKADEIFAKGKRFMPHSLGHGIGLNAHESPLVNSRPGNSDVFESGMIVSLEPGLYDEKNGGCRLENDILITEAGNEVLTHSRIIRL